jgi:hypothetical protein
MPRDMEARKKYLEEYLKRPEVIARKREIYKKYKKSPKGVERTKRYNKSPKGVDSKKRYEKSHKGVKNRRRGALFSKYKITEQRYFEILEKQIGLCAICGSDSSRRRGMKNFAIDHDHTTMEVRGLLCHPCNVMLGLAKDNIEILETAIKYLKDHKETIYVVE